jgi:hypothetical protein
MKYLRILLFAILAVCAVQILYSCGRTIQAITHEVSRISMISADRIPEGVRFGHSNLMVLREFSADIHPIPTDAAVFACGSDPELDQDGDGLSGRQEFWLLTSDEHADSDDDGIRDSDDPCPNCYALSHLDEMRSSIIRNLLSEDAGPDTFYVGTPGEAQLDVHVPFTTVVSVSNRELDFLAKRTSLFPRESSSQTGHMRITDRIWIPGFLYVGDVDSWCGSRCGAGNTYFVLDLAVAGPTTVWVGTRWIS